MLDIADKGLIVGPPTMPNRRRTREYYAEVEKRSAACQVHASPVRGKTAQAPGPVTPGDLADMVNLNNSFLLSLGIPSSLLPQVAPEQMAPVLSRIEEAYDMESLSVPDLFTVGEAECALSMLERTLGSLEGEMEAMAEAGIGRMEAINQLRAENDPFRDMTPAEIAAAIKNFEKWGLPEVYLEYALLLHTGNQELREAYMDCYRLARAGAFDAPGLDFAGAWESGMLSFNLNLGLGVVVLSTTASYVTFSTG